MIAARSVPPHPVNEPIRAYAPGSPERAALWQELERQSAETAEIPCVVAGRRVFTGQVVEVRNPSDHAHVLARVHLATPALVAEACEAAMRAKGAWASLAWEGRSAVFLRAAALLAGPWRDRLNAATMLGQGKTCHQAEIDAACELIDFWRFGVADAATLLDQQPRVSPEGVWNRADVRPLDGFVFAVTPFNFTAIALNLPTAPAILGNVAVWKPSLTQTLSAWYGMQLLEAAGLPPGVLNLVHGAGADVGDIVLDAPDLGGLHFTGSTATFRSLWRGIGDRLDRYRQIPRIVGETGGKDFIVVHASADVDAVAVAALRGAFEYQGQKCSAASRMYVPASLWPRLRERLAGMVAELTVGDVRDPRHFVGPVIDERAARRLSDAIARGRAEGHVVAGGKVDVSTGWFVHPTVVHLDDPAHPLLREELFGPLLAVRVYPDAGFSDVLREVDAATPYALTGAVFADDRYALDEAATALRFAAGNLYLNDKPTGAVVGQQPFGGGRASGTNDKAGSVLNLMRWASPRILKETFVPPTDWRYPFLGR
jgi:1-pyrroline-5-carboxylate dehydrogenase